MKIDGISRRTLWLSPDGIKITVIDQTQLPHAFATRELRSVDDAALAIKEMVVRGAPLIGAAAAYGVALAMSADPSDAALTRAYNLLLVARPTAVNLRWALEDMRSTLRPLAPAERAHAAYARAAALCDEDVAINQAIGEHGLALLGQALAKKKRGDRLNIMTHCNAGWLATVDWGTATAPIYRAHDAGLPVHVWVSETRPRNQGAALTAWELGQHGVAHTIVVDNAAGLLMRRGEVDLVIVGTDRTTATGDVCNKIGTYLKALAARDNGIAFYVAVPSPSIDWTLDDGMRVPIEERGTREVTHLQGRTDAGELQSVRVTPQASAVSNLGFDITPAHLVSALITERGVCPASRDGLLNLFPERVHERAATA
jgi:methylthioribose-1-phosphate isomerase